MIQDSEAKEFIAFNLNRILEKHDISRYRLAKLTDESEQTIKSVADGAHVPRVSLLARITEALSKLLGFRITVDDLLKPPPAPPKKSGKKLQEVA